jgi:hypothetical protein
MSTQVACHRAQLARATMETTTRGTGRDWLRRLHPRFVGILARQRVTRSQSNCPVAHPATILTSASRTRMPPRKPHAQGSRLRMRLDQVSRCFFTRMGNGAPRSCARIPMESAASAPQTPFRQSTAKHLACCSGRLFLGHAQHRVSLREDRPRRGFTSSGISSWTGTRSTLPTHAGASSSLRDRRCSRGTRANRWPAHIRRVRRSGRRRPLARGRRR